MAEEESVLQTVEGFLTEEQWTRKAITDFTVADLEELEECCDQILSDGQQVAVRELCARYQNQGREKSAVALYLTGVVGLSRQRFDDGPLLKLAMIFLQHNRWQQVEYVAQRVLKFGENKVALRLLCDYYGHEKLEEERFVACRRLLRVDYEEVELILELANHLEAQGELAEALEYYHKTLHRYLSLNRLASLTTLWEHLVALEPQNLDFFWQVYRKVSRLNAQAALELLEKLHPVYQQRGDWKEAVQVLKWILEADPTHPTARRHIVEAFLNLYQGHSQVEACIRLSNLQQQWRNASEAIADFEKHISFDSGNFVFHNSWGVGRIRSIVDDKIVIDFVKKRGHEMGLQMAISALQSIGKNHIWVLKSVVPQKKLHEQVKSNTLWTLKVIIRSFNNQAGMKEIKHELVPQVLSEKEWSSWGQEARQMLKHESCFGVHPEKADVFVVQEKPVSLPDKLYNRFTGEDDFFKRVQIVDEYLETCEVESDYFNEMFQYFCGVLKSQNVTEQLIASYLYTAKIHRRYPFLELETDWTFAQLYGALDRPGEVYVKINNAQLRRDFVLAMSETLENWKDEVVKIFPYGPSSLMIELLEEEGEYDRIAEIVTNLFTRFRELRSSFLWLVSNGLQQSWFQRLNFPSEKVWITMIRLLDLSYRGIESKRDLQNNRRIHKGMANILFKEGKLQGYLLSADEKTVQRIMQLLTSIKGLANYEDEVRTLRQTVEKHFSHLELTSAAKVLEGRSSVSSQGMLVTTDQLDEKKRELRHLLEVEIPQNSLDIGRAIELGDLSENAEYKDARERQENLNIQVGRLRNEIERARVFDSEQVDTSRVSFGTRVTLLDLDGGQHEEYTILGPWESSPENKILSYLSPFGAALLNVKVDEKVEFQINNRHFNYQVLAIRSAFDTIDVD